MRGHTLLALTLCVACIATEAAPSPVHLHARNLKQSNTAASAVAIDNKSDQTTTDLAQASSSAQATSTSLTPLPPVQQCIQYNNTNANGDVIQFTFAPNAGACCDLCSQTQGCNVYVFCPRVNGCDNGYGIVFAPFLCTLKYQTLASGSEPTTYSSGTNVPWTSGIVTETSLGYCVGYAEAAAEAQATAG